MKQGLCRCGCGGKTNLITGSDFRKGWVKGEYMRFLRGHARISSAQPYILDPVTGCWLWMRSLNNKGYPRVNIDGYNYAHIMYYERAKGKVPEGMELDHICRTPACVNPEHLEAVTHQTNIRRCPHTKLTEDLAAQIRRLNAQGLGYRKLARIFNIHRSTVCHLVTERNWHVSTDTRAPDAESGAAVRGEQGVELAISRRQPD